MGVDFGGNKSAFSFVASGNKRDRSKLTALMSERHPAKGIDPDEMYKRLFAFTDRVTEKYGPVRCMYCDSAEQTLINGIRARTKIPVANSIKNPIADRIRAANSLIALGRFYYTEDCRTLKAALSTAIYDPRKYDDERLDDGTSDIDTLDAWEYSWERDILRYAKGKPRVGLMDGLHNRG